MIPSPQEESAPVSGYQNEEALTGEEVVISGISGLFPNSNNVMEFMENLYNKVDMVTEDELKLDHVELSKYSGKISGIHKFDAQFFRVTHAQAHTLEPMCKKMLEQAYCAIYDAGINPVSLKGKKIGIFTAALNPETVKFIIYNQTCNGFGITGSSKTMLANRISYWLDAKGPSYNIESHSGSMICLEHAVNSIRTGVCDAAIVGGCEFTNDSVLSINQRNAGLLSLDGKTRCFDKNGDGYVQSQALSMLFLQKAKDAKRIYAVIRNVGVEYGLKEDMELSQKRKSEEIVRFLETIYADSYISPNQIEYIEAYGAANPEADANELQAISQMFGSKKPIKVGCVKSNMGNNESASGGCAIIKLCLAYNKGKLPGNLHYDDPLDIPAIKEKKIEVLTETTQFNRGLTAVNNFSYGGTNCHVVLEGHFKPKNANLYKTSIPRLVTISGRHEEGVKKIFDILKNQPIDPELIGMLNNIYQVDTPGFTSRGYVILDTKAEHTVSLTESTKLYQGTQRPLCLIYSGMGSQWVGMGADLMRIPLFTATVEKCRQILEPKGVDIVRILTSPDNTIFDNVLNSFVGIAATQIALTDIIRELGLVPDYIIGHSLGEMGCAYYDGCFTLEEYILTAYARGLVSINTKLIKGSMAAVGLGYKDMLALCPPEIDIACHNSSEFCTISGPTEVMGAFILELKAKGIFAKEVASSNIAYHSRYIQKAGPEFLRSLKDIIETPVKRSKKWISTSWPVEKWNEPCAQYSSAEYHTNNLLSSVYFEEAARLIPPNAVVVEVAPHGLMQAILKRSHPQCTHIPLTKRGHEQPIQFLFEALGKLYQEGYNIRVDALYPKIEYPVSTETPLLSHFVELYHEEDWIKQTYYIRKRDEKILTPSRMIYVSMQEDDFKFLAGHCREGNIVLPEAAILFYVWETLAMYRGVDHKQISVKFYDVQFHAEVLIDLVDTVTLKISLNKGNKYFEVTRDNVVIVNGNICVVSSKFKQVSNIIDVNSENNNIDLTCDDIYNLFKIKGYCYQNQFKSIISSSSHWSTSQVRMTGNWITFLDSLIQLNILATNYEGVSIPKIIKELSIDMTDHTSLNLVQKQNKLFNVQLCKTTGLTKGGGVTIKHVIFKERPIAEYEPDVLKTLTYRSQNFTDTINKTNFNDTMVKSKEYKLTCSKSDGKKCLKWTEMNTNSDYFVKVCFAAPSMRDVQNVIGLVDSRKDLGMDFSGIDSNGNKVMGLVAGGALASKVEPDRDLLWPVPEHWTLEEAATVPLPYVHAYYCLLLKGNVLPRHTIFVTGGAGALGQAVIATCLSLGCTVYTSVSDVQKKMFLLKLFPRLNENNIGYSNDSSFSNMVITNSKNNRCDFVINCATGYIRELAMKCVGFTCMFLDVNNYDLQQNKELGMRYLEGEKKYQIVNLSSIFRLENVTEKKLLQKWISEGIANGTVRPTSYVEYSTNDVERTFRLLSLSRHRGRVLIKFDDSDTLSITPRIQYTSNGAYLVVCDNEIDFGIQITNHLVKRGAKHIIFYQKNKKISGLVESQIVSWQNLGVAVTIFTGNVQKSNCIDLLKKNVNIIGIFIVLPRIRYTENSLQDTFIESIDLDIETVNVFDQTSRNNCPELKYFVILANNFNNVNNFKPTLLDEVCQLRVQDGLPALLVYSTLSNESLNYKSCKIRPVTIQATLKAMEISLKQNAISVLAYNKKEKTFKFLDAIAEILGIKNIHEIDDNVSLEEFASKEIILEEMKSVIKEYYKYDLPAEYVKKMKISSLKHLKEAQQKYKFERDTKLAAFYNFVDQDEISATQTFVAMHTLTSSAEGERNLYAKATNLVLIPGFEGHHHIFKSLCEGLKIRATTLQLGPDFSHGSIQEIALELKQQIKRRFILESKFYLLGYSFGVNVALEIASLLEQDGLVGVVYCLDSSPDALRVQLNAYLGHLTEAELQNAIINHLFYVMSGQKCKILENELNVISAWEKKVTRCVERLKGVVNYSNQYKRSLIESFYSKIKLSKGYNPKFALGSKIILLKGSPHPKADYLPADYGLSKYAKNPVKVIEINSDVASAPYDSSIANTVNQFLDPTLLEDFKAKNLCECYSITHI